MVSWQIRQSFFPKEESEVNYVMQKSCGPVFHLRVSGHFSSVARAASDTRVASASRILDILDAALSEKLLTLPQAASILEALDAVRRIVFASAAKGVKRLCEFA